MVPPLYLKGLKLLDQYPPSQGAWFPTQVPLSALVEATEELMVYTQSCKQLARQLVSLPACPLTSITLVEFVQ